MEEEDSTTFGSEIFELKLGKERIAQLKQLAGQTNDPIQKAVYLGKASSIKSEIAGKGKLSGSARKNKQKAIQAKFKAELDSNPEMERYIFQKHVDQYAAEYNYKDKNIIKRILKEVLEKSYPHLIAKLLPRSK